MVSALDIGVSDRGSGPGQGHDLRSWARCPSPPRCINEYQRTYCWGVTLRWTEIYLVASCYGNRDKLRPDEPLGWILFRFRKFITYILITVNDHTSSLHYFF